MKPKGPLSLYFHIPFCRHKCAYCHFYVIPDQERHQLMLMDGLEREWARVADCVRQHDVVSVYLGGGTPARLSPERVATILSWIGELGDAEVTLEANPDDVTKERMKAYRDAGVNRISLGVQTFDRELLKRLERLHDDAQAESAVYALQDAGFENITIDLMYDLPGQDLASWQRTLDRASRLPVAHVSLYNLQIEPHTVFFKHREQVRKEMPDEESSALMLQSACERLEAVGLQRYEISAFGRPSRHNSGYWQGRPFLGLGPSAFSYYEGRRFRNVAHLHRYCRSLEEGKSAIDFEETLDSAAQQRELLVVGLRMLAGVDLANFRLDRDCEKSLDRLIGDGLLIRDASRLKLSERGLAYHDHIASELI